ncbi:uncharacterized protein LOC120427364 [Culex pipiens pallens]|uniref:uncharacterized protein LOC120427364 n=1 Tax=Culex pipiens pallens TaxID=42434 RepID=UPI00195456A8|nr:uncharacterized protein LOC120427364 [Culex pipiens pallens]
MSDKDSLDEPEGGGGGGDIEIETMDEYECLELEKLIINEWGMPRSSLNRMIYCGITVRCLEVIQDSEINELFNDPRMLGSKIVFKHQVKELQATALISQMGALGAARKRRHHSAEMGFGKMDNNGSMLDQPKRIKLELDSPDTPVNLLEPIQSLHPLDGPLPMHDLPQFLENGSLTKPSTANPLAGNLPIRITPESLRQLLQASRQGQWVLSYYNTYHTMNRKIQAALTHCIVEQFLVYNIMFSHRLMRHYAHVITMLFPTESAEVYYKPAQALGWKRTCASGKLMDRWANQRMRHKDRYPQQRPRILDDTSDQRTFAEMSLVIAPVHATSD